MTVSELKTAETNLKDEFNRMAIATKMGKEGGTQMSKN